MKEMVEKYIALRDKKAQITAEYKEKVAGIDEVLTKVEAALLHQFKTMGVESVRTSCGTAFRSTRYSATVADWDSVLDFIKNNGHWQMLDHRVSKKAVEEYREEHGDLPPGVNWREEVTVNVRRA
jgi:hypothetical protein